MDLTLLIAGLIAGFLVGLFIGLKIAKIYGDYREGSFKYRIIGWLVLGLIIVAAVVIFLYKSVQIL